MKINHSTPNFKARNLDIRNADRICRMVNAKVPTISPSKLKGKAVLQRNLRMYDLSEILQEKLEEIVRDPAGNYVDKNSLEFYKFFVSALKKAKLTNCGEKARLASLICAVNGIETKLLTLWSACKKNRTLKRDLDHEVLVISPSSERFSCDILQNMQNKIFIDPWLGIVGYGDGMAVEYRRYFERFKGIDKNFEDIDKLHFAVFPKEKVTNKNTEELRKIFPEFIIDKK